jgi:hypothetical protein
MIVEIFLAVTLRKIPLPKVISNSANEKSSSAVRPAVTAARPLQRLWRRSGRNFAFSHAESKMDSFFKDRAQALLDDEDIDVQSSVDGSLVFLSHHCAEVWAHSFAALHRL